MALTATATKRVQADIRDTLFKHHGSTTSSSSSHGGGGGGGGGGGSSDVAAGVGSDEVECSSYTCENGFHRQNLLFSVINAAASERNAGSVLPPLLRGAGGGTSIIYCPTRKMVERCAEALAQAGFRAAGYHAGMSQTVRKQVHADFISGNGTSYPSERVNWSPRLECSPRPPPTTLVSVYKGCCQKRGLMS